MSIHFEMIAILMCLLYDYSVIIVEVEMSSDACGSRFVRAQRNFRDSKRGSGFVRIQPWIPREIRNLLKIRCKEHNMTQESFIIDAISNHQPTLSKAE